MSTDNGERTNGYNISLYKQKNLQLHSWGFKQQIFFKTNLRKQIH